MNDALNVMTDSECAHELINQNTHCFAYLHNLLMCSRLATFDQMRIPRLNWTKGKPSFSFSFCLQQPPAKWLGWKEETAVFGNSAGLCSQQSAQLHRMWHTL